MNSSFWKSRNIIGAILSLFLFASLLLPTARVAAESPVPAVDHNPTAPLSAPGSAAQPRYISGFGLDNNYTIFYEDRNDTSGCVSGSYIYFDQTTTGPLGFAAAGTKTNICDTHFLVKDWPITVFGTTYNYRAWGSGNNDGTHNFYGSNDLIHWSLITTFTFDHTSDGILYGFHDIVKLNDNYIGWVESAGGNTYIAWSDNGDGSWTIGSQVGGATAGASPLSLYFFAGITGPKPSGNFVLMDLDGQKTYTKLYLAGDYRGAYMAINRAAAQAVLPADAEAAFMNPANWTWRSGTTGLPSSADTVITNTKGTGGHDVREAWMMPTSDYHSDHGFLYTASYSAGGANGLGWASSAPSVVWVDDDYNASGCTTDGHTWGVDCFAVIQNGINAVAGGGTVNVAPGNYMEALDIVGKNINLISTVPLGATIQSPDTLATDFTTSAANKAIVYLNNTTSTINGFVVDGLSKGNANYRFFGVAFYNAAGTIQNCTVKNIQDTPFSGAQHGNGIYAYDNENPPRTINVLNNTVFDYQKNGITMNGASLTAHVEGNTVTGKGTTDVTAQNGIQFGFGASGTLKNNTVTGNSFHLAGSTWDWGAAGILLAGSGSVTLEGGNTMSGNSQNLYISNPTGPIAVGAETFASLTGPIESSYHVINFSNSNIDLSQSNFDGVNFSTATPDQILPFAGLIYDGIDDGTYGIANLKSGYQFVDPEGTIQAAIDASDPGGTVLVQAGTYDESLDIHKPISVLGQGAGVTSIDRSGTATAGTVVTIHTMAGNVTFDGFTIKTGPASTVASNGISVSGLTGLGTITISNNIIWAVQSPSGTAKDNFGLIAGYFTATTPKLVFDHNTVHGGGGNPILIENWMGPTEITNNTLDNGVKDNTSSDVIFMMNHDGSQNDQKQLISGNTIDMGWGTIYDSPHRGAGISIAGSYTGGTTPGGFTNVEISNNTIFNLKTSRRGISLWNNSSNGTGGDIANALITGNTISNAPTYTGEFGIRLLGKTTGTQISNNLLSGVTDAVKIQPYNGHEASGTILQNNSLLAVVNGVNNTTTTLADANTNWWGNLSGPSSVGPGTGSHVSAYVTFTPWIKSFTNDPAKAGQPGFWPISIVTDSPCTTDCYVAKTGNDSATGSTVSPFLTIKKGVDTVSSSGTVHVAAGAYDEQVIINKGLTLQGVGDTTIIRPSQTTANGFTLFNRKNGGSANVASIILTNTSQPATIEDLKVDGSLVTTAIPGAEGLIGILYRGNPGLIDTVTVTGIDVGTEAGLGIYLSGYTTPVTVTVNNSTISAYKKNGITASYTNMNALLTGNTITGMGPTDSIAQNGIQIGYGATATVSGNTISNHVWTATYISNTNDPASDLEADGATGILLYLAGSGVEIHHNTLTGNQFGVWTVAIPDVNIHDNTITGLAHTGKAFPTGIAISSADQWTVDLGGTETGTVATIANNTIATNDYGLLVLDYISGGVAPSVTVTGNTFTNNATQAMATGSSVFNTAATLAGNNFDRAVTVGHPVTLLPAIWGKIQGGIDAAVAGDTVNVAAGTYVEDPYIDRPLTLLGPNATINPNTGSRGPEAIILPSVSDPNPSSCETMVYLTASDVTIKGFTFDGDNPALTSTIYINGANVDACVIMASYQGIGNITVENNILKNATYAGMDFYNYYNGTAATSNNYIRYNKIDGIGETTYNWGIGILVTRNFYADVTDNVITHTRVGIQADLHDKPNPGATGSVRNNQVSTWRVGLFLNQQWSGLTPLTIANNTFTAENYSGADNWSGMVISTVTGTATTTITGNNFTVPGTDTHSGFTSGYNVWSVSTSAPITISGGTVTGGDYGVFVNNWEGYLSGPDTPSITTITIDGVTILNSDIAGVYVKDNPLNTHPAATVYANIQNSIIDTNATGILVEGLDATAKANYNNLSSNPTAGITNHNGTTWVMDASGNWFGNNTPAGVKALVSTNVDYTPWLNSGTDTLPGTPGFQGDFSSLWVDDDSPQTGATGRIQEGINMVSGSTVHVAPGMYTERLFINKAVELLGPTATVNKAGSSIPVGYAWDTAVQAVINYPDPTGLGVDTVLVDIQHGDVTFKGFVVQILNARVSSDHLLRLNTAIAGTGTLNNVKVENNFLGPVTNVALQDGTYGRMGLYFSSPTYPSQPQGITNSHIAGNVIFDARGNGDNVFIWGSAHAYGSLQNADYTGTVVEDNDIFGSHRSGIEIAGGVSGLTIQNNRIYSNSSTNGGSLDSNLKYGNGIVIIRMGGDKCDLSAKGVDGLSILNNEIYNNEKNGIYTGPFANNIHIDSNNIHNNGLDGVRIDLTEAYYGGCPVYNQASNIDANLNKITGNGLNGVQVIGTPTNGFVLDATHNWWGNILGPQSLVPADIQVNKWCAQAACTTFLPDDPNTITLSGTINQPGGLNVYVPGLTILLADGTVVQNTGAHCFGVNASNTTIQAVTRLGARCVPGAGNNGVDVAGGLQDINILNIEFAGPGTDGIHFAGVTDYLAIVDNWFHNLAGDAVKFLAEPTPTGIVSIQGNLFQDNTGLGINAGAFTVPAEFNSWASYAGAATGDGASAHVDTDPWTHVDLYITTTGTVTLNGNATFTVYGDLKNVMGAAFTLTYPTAKLQLVGSPVNLSGFVAAGPTLFDLVTPGAIKFNGIVPGSTPISGAALPIYQVTFKVLAEGGLLDLVDTNDLFSMFPNDAGPSTNIYAYKLVDTIVMYNYTVWGTVTMQSRSVRSGVPGTLTALNYGPYQTTSVQGIPNNLVFLNVYASTYTFTTLQPRYLNIPASMAKTFVLTGDRTLPNLVLKGGNAIWTDNVINIQDATKVGTEYGIGNITYDSDVNFDGVVNIFDLTLVGGNFDLTSATAYASWVP